MRATGLLEHTTHSFNEFLYKIIMVILYERIYTDSWFTCVRFLPSGSLDGTYSSLIFPHHLQKKMVR